MKQLIGSILLAVGILIAGTSGLCSAAFLVSFVVSAMNASGPGQFGVLSLVLIFGAPPFLIGFGLFKLGQSLIREADRET